MKKPTLLIIITILYSLSVKADMCGPNGNQVIEEISEMTGDILESSGQLNNCDWNDPISYAKEVQNIKTRLSSLLNEIANYDVSSLDKKTTSRLKTVKRILSCVQAKKIDRLKVSCRNDIRSCHETLAYVKTLGFLEGRIVFADKNVFLCKGFFSDLTPRAQRSTILHELTHLCGTKDLTYFSYEPYELNNPNDKTKHWQRNADHYEYWFNNGFCIPDKDC